METPTTPSIEELPTASPAEQTEGGSVSHYPNLDTISYAQYEELVVAAEQDVRAKRAKERDEWYRLTQQEKDAEILHYRNNNYAVSAGAHEGYVGLNRGSTGGVEMEVNSLNSYLAGVSLTRAEAEKLRDGLIELLS